MTDEERKAAQEKAGIEAAKAKAVIAAAIAEAQAPLIKGMSDLTEQIAAMVKSGAGAVATGSQKSTSNMGDVRDTGVIGSVTGGESAAKGSGIQATRVIKAHLAIALRKEAVTHENISKQLERWGYADEKRAFERTIEKGLSQSVFADGGAVVPIEYSTELIALLRNQTAIRKMGARGLPMGAALEIPSAESAATAYYVGEGVAITASQPGFGSIRLAEKKLAALVVVSNDLIRNAILSAEEFVRDDLVQVMALKEDYQGFFGVGSEYSPRGLVNLTIAANQYNSTAVAQATPTLAEIKKELAKAVRVAMESNIPMAKMGWVFNPRTWSYLWSITDGNGNSIYQAEMATGKLLGHPFLVTNQIPNTLTWSVDGSADVSRIFFGDWAQFLIGESMTPQIEVFPNAAYDVAGTVVSGISKDQSVIRALAKHDFNLRYRNAFVIISTRMGA